MKNQLSVGKLYITQCDLSVRGAAWAAGREVRIYPAGSLVVVVGGARSTMGRARAGSSADA